jgi:hypothetical protein
MDITHTYVYYLIAIICVIAGYTKSYAQNVNPNKNIHTKNKLLKLLTIGINSNTQIFSLKKRDIPYTHICLCGNPIIWYGYDKIFYVNNDTFFGINFNMSFNYKNYIIRVGDSSEKLITILLNF